MQPTSRSRFGNICGVAAVLVFIVGLCFPARPGGLSETGVWFFISMTCVMTVLGIAGLRYGALLGKLTGAVVLVFVLLIVLQEQGALR